SILTTPLSFYFFFTATAPTALYTLSLHDALPIFPGKISTVDLTTGTFTKFTGVGLGDVNGLAVDPATGTACTTTEIDFSVEFYRSEEHTSELQSLAYLVCRLLLEKKKKQTM